MKWKWCPGGAGVALLVCVLHIGLAGCDQKEEGGAGAALDKGEPASPEEVEKPEPVLAGPAETKAERKEAPAGGAPPAAEPDAKPVPPKKPWTLDHAGFAARLPQDVEFYADTRRLNWLWEWVGKTGAMEELEKFMAGQEERGMIPKELTEAIAQGASLLPLLFGEEGFVAARGLAWSLEAGLGINEWMNQALGEALTKGIVTGNMEALLTDEAFSVKLSKGAAQWLRENLDKTGGDPHVAFYAGGRVEEERRAEVLGWIKKLLAKAADESEKLKAIEFEQSGATWSGFEIGIDQFEGFDPEEEAPAGLDAEIWKAMLKQMAGWSLVVACAEVDDYVVLAAGNGKRSIVLTEARQTSLASREGFKFFEQYDVNSLFGTMWASKNLIGAMHGGSSYLPLFQGIEKGLKESPGLKRGAEMVKAVSEFNALWTSRRAGVAHEWVGAVFLGDGLRAETRGGWDAAGLDLKTPLKFAKAFAGLEKEPLVRAHWKRKASYLEEGHKQVEAGMRFLKLVGEEAMEYFGEAAAEEGEDELVERFGRWKRDLGKGLDDIAEGYREHFSKAFGEESAFVMDLEGAMIPAVGVDEDLLKKGRIPRAAFVRPVVKREALSESWKIWNSALTNLFGILAEGMDQPIPFPDTMTAEKDDLRTYFFPFPFETDDFLPSVSVSDDLFILGSSKTLSESLYESARKAEGGAVAAGLWVDVKTEGLWDFCEAWLGVYELRRNTKEEIEEDERLREQGDADNPAAKGAAQAQQDLDRILERAKALREAGETEIPQELLDAVEELEVPAEIEEAAEKLEKLKESLKVAPEQPAIPEEPEIPRVEVENPLLKELLQGAEGEAPGNDEPPVFEEDPEGLDELLHDLEHEDDLPPGPAEIEGDHLVGPLGLEFLDFPKPEVLRSMLEKARLFRGLRYRRWSEDGIPRSSLRVDWSGR